MVILFALGGYVVASLNVVNSGTSVVNRLFCVVESRFHIVVEMILYRSVAETSNLGILVVSTNGS